MSGIAGWIDWENDLTSQGPALSSMGDTLAHRGPDGAGQWLSPHAALAHRRLSVIDPQTGGQPMIYQENERKVVITCDGAVYNFHELRSELESYGYVFRTSSDTEVILHAYTQWGKECVRRFNGIFAFGLWDEQQQLLLLARDRLGMKPLFYAQRGNAVLFASELKALLAHPLMKTEIDAAGLAQVLTYVRTPGSGIYRGVQEVRPGHMILWDARGPQVSRYWSLHSAPHRDDVATTADYIRTLLEDTLKRQMIADVPVATLLSGGLDSSLLTWLAARNVQATATPLRTYSIDFVESAQHFHSDFLHISLDEPWARSVADYLGTRHRTITVEPTALVEHLLVQLYAHDIPMVGQMNTSLYLLFKAIKQESTVALSGEAADEIFGGYPWFHHEAILKAPTFPWLPAFLGQDAHPLAWLSADILQLVNPDEHIARTYRQTIDEVPRLANENELAVRRREMTYLNLTHWLPFLLERKDRMGMAAGLELRVPFGDHRLVEYVWNIPWEMKTLDALEKGILRRAFAETLPSEILYRRKSAYPSVQHPVYDQETRLWALAILDNPRAAIQPLLNSQVARSLVNSAGSGRSGIAQVSLFERIILLNEWLEKYHVSLSL